MRLIHKGGSMKINKDESIKLAGLIRSEFQRGIMAYFNVNDFDECSGYIVSANLVDAILDDSLDVIDKFVEIEEEV